ncbi:AraC family transcriptional regulator [Sedimentisphaera salicampi]|uniref:Arabinose operon regulatory protein n=1 Tax=Sedimentisphaera salicampi TaxID=1941349 RepID=A0A1W6LQ14_9BACT|nr:AraC family transcriptional regulator [Sedimentisphaera salicampi]ARN57822.1 Arabinose operon regulatory protein [Sedimentisphaera salicampi]
MKNFVNTANTVKRSQVLSLFHNENQYRPLFLHGAIHQDRPVGPKRTFSEHSHPFYHIVLYTDGHGEYLKEGLFHKARPGTCVLLSPGQKHDFVSHWQKTVYSEITFAFKSENGLLLELPFEKLIFLLTGVEAAFDTDLIFSNEQTNTLNNMFSDLIEYLNSSSIISQYQANFGLLGIFNFIVKHHILTAVDSSSISPMDKVKAYIEENYTNQIPIEKLTSMVHLSKGYFFRAFKKKFGVSPITYQQIIRINASKTLLKTTSLRCNEIADRVGFSDVYFFHRTFKKHTGKTPSSYRAGKENL